MIKTKKTIFKKSILGLGIVILLIFKSYILYATSNRLDPRIQLKKIAPPTIRFPWETESQNEITKPPVNIPSTTYELTFPKTPPIKSIIENTTSNSAFIASQTFDKQDTSSQTSSITTALISSPPTLLATTAAKITTKKVTATETQKTTKLPKSTSEEKPTTSAPIVSTATNSVQVSQTPPATSTQTIKQLKKPVATASAKIETQSIATSTAITAKELKEPKTKPSSETHSINVSAIASEAQIETTVIASASESAGESEAADTTETNNDNDEKPQEPQPVDEQKLAEAEKAANASDWKKLESILRDNPQLENDTRGIQLKLLSLLNAKKINSLEVKRVAEMLLNKDAKDPYGNYGMGYYYLNAKKPNLDKALEHLSKAKKHKKAPPGVSGLYWKATLKKRWLIILIIIGCLIAGIDAARKKLKVKRNLELEQQTTSDGQTSQENIQSGETTAGTADAAAKNSILGKVKALIAQLQGLSQKLRKQTDSTTPEDSVERTTESIEPISPYNQELQDNIISSNSDQANLSNPDNAQIEHSPQEVVSDSTHDSTQQS